ncbi:hypothetical protein Ga0080574_TMP4918 (plasmid) [Salipiger abyssi]|uniref:Uncharacterized protein n=1 Tax=Salipiger abyssi TaxID=1250539 RepID=A0A1P8V0M2_9RHOB|nr:hypothetical protein Ga0080574_TMP4918 [Salipiger abyssi]
MIGKDPRSTGDGWRRARPVGRAVAGGFCHTHRVDPAHPKCPVCLSGPHYASARFPIHVFDHIRPRFGKLAQHALF